MQFKYFPAFDGNSFAPGSSRHTLDDCLGEHPFCDFCSLRFGSE